MFHDDYLIGISIDHKRREVRLAIQSEHGPGLIELSGVEMFLANEVREGNIILSVEAVSGQEIVDRIRAGQEWGFATLLGKETKGPFFERTLERLSRKELTYFELLSSYGVNTFALCKEVRMQEASSKPESEATS